MKNKEQLQERWGSLLNSSIEEVPNLRALYLDPERNATGCLTHGSVLGIRV